MSQKIEGITEKSRRQVWWNWIRARLPLFLLLGIAIWGKPAWNLIGVPFLLLGQGVRAWAIGYLHKDRRLATAGPYALCRHPLYLGTFLSGIGICLLVGSWVIGVIFLLVFVIIYIPTFGQEDAYLEKVYGESFRAYAAQVPAFLPRLRMAKVDRPQRWTWGQLISNEEHLTWAAMVIFLVALAVRQRL